ncbi:MAG: hypothetical protein JNL82_38845 [Myxococcales bacterium]|jgi:hypothetical protein|nr:hypothetical protein [Myxococcales bacterium]
MSLLRLSLSLTLSASLALPSVALAGPPPPPPPKPGAAAAPDQPPDPNSVSSEERLKWAKKLFTEASAAHEAEDFYNSVIKFEQAYTFAPDKHIFAFNIGQDAWELRDCARVKQYLELFLIKETSKEDLRKKAQELLAKAEGNSECVTGGPAPSSGGGGGPTQPKSGPAEDSEDPLLQKKPRGGDDEIDDSPKKRGASGLLIGGVIMTVVGIGAAGGGIGTMLAAKGKAGAAEDAAGISDTTNFPQGSYDNDVQKDIKTVKTLNLMTPILIGVGGALLVGGIVMIVVDRGNKKKGKGFYANQGRVQLSGLGATPLPGGGAAGSLALRF